MYYTLLQGLIKETATDTFCLTEEPATGKGLKGIPDVCEDEETESITASAHDQREEELQVCCIEFTHHIQINPVFSIGTALYFL